MTSIQQSDPDARFKALFEKVKQQCVYCNTKFTTFQDWRGHGQECMENPRNKRSKTFSQMSGFSSPTKNADLEKGLLQSLQQNEELFNTFKKENTQFGNSPPKQKLRSDTLLSTQPIVSPSNKFQFLGGRDRSSTASRKLDQKINIIINIAGSSQIDPQKIQLENVEYTHTILNIKKKIALQKINLNSTPENYNLSLEGEILLNNRLISTYNIENGTAIDLTYLGPYKRVQDGFLGGGAQGKVYKMESQSKEIYAGKTMSLNEMPKTEMDRALIEAKTHFQMDHTNIIKLYEIQFVSDSDVNLIMEYAEKGSLKSKINELCGNSKNKEYFPEKDILLYMIGVGNGIEYIHHKNILHCDLKSSNILITEDNVPKVSDFGIAQLIASSSSKVSQKRGTLEYQSPEAFKGEPIGTKADIWGLGVTFFELCNLELPFKSKSGGKVEAATVNAVLNSEPSKFTNEYSQDLKNLIYWCLQKKPENSSKRSSLKEFEEIQGIRLSSQNRSSSSQTFV